MILQKKIKPDFKKLAKNIGLLHVKVWALDIITKPDIWLFEYTKSHNNTVYTWNAINIEIEKFSKRIPCNLCNIFNKRHVCDKCNKNFCDCFDDKYISDEDTFCSECIIQSRCSICKGIDTSYGDIYVHECCICKNICIARHWPAACDPPGARVLLAGLGVDQDEGPDDLGMGERARSDRKPPWLIPASTALLDPQMRQQRREVVGGV